jgi:hypothetical protein
MKKDEQFFSVDKIMNKLYERNYIKKLHKEIKTGLIGTLKDEYTLRKPIGYPYEQYCKETDTFISLPMFHAIVDMMVANLLDSISKTLIYEVLDAIKETQTCQCAEESER